MKIVSRYRGFTARKTYRDRLASRPARNRQRARYFLKKRSALEDARFRRRLFRCFRDWYRENRRRFSLPLYLVTRSDRRIELLVGDIPGERMLFYISAGNREDESALCFFWKGQCIDSACWHWVAPCKSSKGYYCAECRLKDPDHPYFPTREALWIDHLFEPILEDVNERIATAEVLVFHFFECSSSAVELVRTDTYSPLPGDAAVVEVAAVRPAAPLSCGLAIGEYLSALRATRLPGQRP
jgi:hypothetical protein